MQCIETFAYLHYAHGTISIYACHRRSHILEQPTTKQLTGHEFCVVCAGGGGLQGGGGFQGGCNV